MIRIIKLTYANDRTRGGMQWREYTTNVAKGEGVQLCSPDLIHGYEDELIAVFMDPVHGDYLAEGGHAWLAEADEIVADDGLKVGVKRLTTLRRIELPTVTLEQRVAWGILHAMEVYDEPGFLSWANAWLSGKDRSCGSANAAAYAAYAAYAAAYAADAAAYAANAADAAADAAYTAAYTEKYGAVYPADAAAYEAAYAAHEAIRTGKKIDHKAIARRAMEY